MNYNDDDEFGDESRKRRRMTKEEAIYGIFFPEDSDEDDYGGRKQKGSSSFAYSTGISFVQSSKGTAEQEARERVAEHKRREEKKKQQQKEKKEKDITATSQGGGGAGLGYSPTIQLPASFGSRGAASRGGIGSHSSAGASSKRAAAAPKPEWERYTKGVGSQILQKMGFKGGSLKEGGIAAPIEAIFKADKGGLGFGSKSKDSKYYSSDEEEEEDETMGEDMEEIGEGKSQQKKKKKKKPSDLWKKGATRKSQKQVYKTAEDLLREENEKETTTKSSTTKQVIIDMTKPEARVISAGVGFGEGSSMDLEAATPLQSFEAKAPQFENSIRSIVDLTEKDIKKIHSKITQERDAIAKWDKQQKEIETRTVMASEQIDRFRQVMSLITECQSKLHSGVLGAGDSINPSSAELDYLFNTFVEIKASYSTEFKSFQLATLALSMVLPLLKQRTRTWNPLQDPTPKELLSLFSDWKDILQNGTDKNSSNKMELDHFTKLTYDALLPKIRSAINNWDPKAPESCLRLIEGWQHILPSSIFNSILDDLVLPKLKYAVESWNPRVDLAVHVWLKPWLPTLGTRLEPLFEPIKQKLAIVLQKWNATDRSAHAMLEPWSGIFEQKMMDALLSKSIVPKLVESMKRFTVNPRQQSIEEFKSLMEWANLLPLPLISSILDDHFWPKFKHALSTWLSSKPNPEEVQRWYFGWKALFPQSLSSYPGVKQQFFSALELMNR
eukprot:TRINITY_DN8847_c0_g1_i1.p1 TRINITY_DN8847_c0_g1~~TRINITY_DN8847_c0_g1_i1.p1  ORF type:complete len:726 (-),score=224.52 TRINITY_DN8847_c0_g1_i1:60-2237(-)